MLLHVKSYVVCVPRRNKGAFTNHNRPRTASKNGYIGDFRTAPGRLPSDFKGAGTILTTHRPTGAGVSETLLPILLAFYSNR